MQSIQEEQLPSFFIAKIQEQYPDHAQVILEGLSSKRITSLRVNAKKAQCGEIEQELSDISLGFKHPDWYEDAFMLPQDSESLLWKTSMYEQGKIYVQSLSSMIPPLVLDARKQSDILDMCAAPGGKTSQMAALYPSCHITACEIQAVRADKLRYNLQKQGAENVAVLQEDARKLSEFFSFDYILLDAPCSGSGTLYAHDPKLHKRFSEALVQKSIKQQRALLEKALTLLKPGGRLVYSTCSILKEENEELIQSVLKRMNKTGAYYVNEHALDKLLESESIPKLPSTLAGALTVAPTQEFEGFFVACLGRRA